MIRTYRLDGLLVQTSVHLPLPPVAVPPDWTVGFEPLGRLEVKWTGSTRDGDVTWARFGRVGHLFRVRLEGVLDLLADPASKQVRVEPLGRDLDEAYLLRRAMPYLVHLAGGVALHAACVRVAGETWLFCGETGSGKSTLALALDAAGHPVLADDHVALILRDDGKVHAEASFPFVDAAPDAVAALRPEVEPAADKQSLRLRTERPGRAAVDHMAFLERGTEEGRASIASVEVAVRLLGDVAFVGDPASVAEQTRRLDVATRLAEFVPAITLTIPDDLGALGAWCRKFGVR